MESSSKRARAPANMSQVAHCLVDGCNADLSLCRDYHRRHKVCETHSKTSRVTIAGREQRFCQQCSRFHSLVEFDEGKRSCRKRLDGHNRRRRKPQPDRNSALDFSNHHSTLTGTTTTTSLLSFTNNNSSPQILPSSVVGFSWPGNIKTETETTVLYNNTNHHQINYNNYKGAASANQLEFSSSDGLNHHHHHNHHHSHNHNHNHDHGHHGREIVGPDGALSLLSSNQSTREMGLVQNEQVLSSPGLVHNYGVLGQHYHNHNHNHDLAAQEINKTVVVDSSHGRNNASTLHFADMFQQQGQEGSSTSGPHQTLTFMWE